MKRLLNLARIPLRERPLVGSTPHDVVHTEGRWRLLRFRPREGGPTHRTPLLMVPSLINRWYVLDLLPDKSFIGYMLEQGHDVFVIDWGTPGPEDRFVSFDDIADRALLRASRRAARLAGAERVHLLGYCMGGTLTAAFAARRPERVAGHVALAAPVRFVDDGGLLSAWTRSPRFDPRALVAAFGNIPWPLMQGAFHLLRPTLNLRKGVSLVNRAWDDRFLDGFLALETWGNDNVSLPGEFYRTWVEELYRKDALARGELTLGGRPVRLSDTTCPTLVVCFQHDNIVPADSAAALVELIGSEDADCWRLPGGHVGAVVSSAAAKGLWPLLSAWWTERDDPTIGARPARAASAAQTRRAG